MQHFLKPALFASLLLTSGAGFAQDNSPYSRYGLGDLVPPTNISLRGMGGLSAAYVDNLSINFNNPASYAQFEAVIDQRTKKLSYGRAVFDVGAALSNRTLISPNTVNRFTTSDLLFSYVQVGVPLRRNWGLSFGIRPISRISYKIGRDEFLRDPVTNDTIQRAQTTFQGSGGSYLPTIGTGFAFNLSSRETLKQSTGALLSFGTNIGYLFGNRESKSLRNIINDSVIFYAADFTSNASFGGLFFNAGTQLEFSSYDKNKKRTTTFRIGASGNWQQSLNGRQDISRQTYALGNAGEQLQIDSVFEQRDQPGEVIFPANYKVGFVYQRSGASGWLIGADYSTGQWDNYRFFNTRDSVQNNWMLNVGGQYYPEARSNYFSRLLYRFGFHYGRDYINIDNSLPLFGASFGAGIPVRISRSAPNQLSRINVALEYSKRGNNDNRLKENIFRLSVGLNLTDYWFIKRRYD